MKPSHAVFRQSQLYALMAVVFMGLSGCAASHRDFGYIPSDSALAEIVVGVDSRESLSESLGAPSVSGVLDDNSYYYVKSKIRYFGALRPKEIEREVLAISFTDAGLVQNVERFSLQDGQIVTLSRRVTESSVTNNTFLRQLLGNIGRFSPEGL